MNPPHTPRLHLAPVIGALVVAVTSLAFALGTATPAGAAVPRVGIGENSASMFEDANYRSLRTRISRKVIAYDFYHHKAEREEFDRWMTGARRAGVRPLIAFNASERRPRHLPTIGAFRKSVRWLRKNYPYVRDISPWNEANHRSQPTRNNPKRAAQYYNATRAICSHCRIVAADVLDQSNFMSWLRIFKRHARKPRLWGLHSYTDANRNRSWRRSTTRRFMASVRGEVWLTEVGGIVAMRDVYRPNERRASRGVRNTLRMALKDRRIKRVYLYSWYGTYQPGKHDFYRWDSGLVSWNGQKRRAGFFVLRKWLAAHPNGRRKP